MPPLIQEAVSPKSGKKVTRSDKLEGTLSLVNHHETNNLNEKSDK